jgi:hypothetical protein
VNNAHCVENRGQTDQAQETEQPEALHRPNVFCQENCDLFVEALVTGRIGKMVYRVGVNC